MMIKLSWSKQLFTPARLSVCYHRTELDVIVLEHLVNIICYERAVADFYVSDIFLTDCFEQRSILL